MKIVRLQAESFKRLEVVDISPDGDLIALGGDNGEGKSSVLDAIVAALGGKAAAPMKPVRTGEEYAIIKLDLGELKVTRYFDEKGDKLKVENAEGATFSSAETMLKGLVGEIAFDPLAFSRMKPEEQAVALRRLVKLSVDPDEVARLNAADYAERRDVNRDGKALKARIEGIVLPQGDLGPKPDRAALADQLAKAADHNAGVERARADLGAKHGIVSAADERAKIWVARAAQLRREAEEADRCAQGEDDYAQKLRAEFDALPPIPEPIDVADLRDQLARADNTLEIYRRRDERDALRKQFDDLKQRSEGYTAKMAERDASVEKALAEADMPVPGLSFGRLSSEEDKPGDLIVTYNGEPFAQASTAEQIRVSVRIAAAMNPKLRVMIVKDGAFLDDKSLALVAEIAKETDCQVWMETVGERNGVGIIMEAGRVRGAPEPERLDAPKRRKAKAEGDETAPAGTGGNLPENGDTSAPSAPPLPARRKPQGFASQKPSDLFGGDQ